MKSHHEAIKSLSELLQGTKTVEEIAAIVDSKFRLDLDISPTSILPILKSYENELRAAGSIENNDELDQNFGECIDKLDEILNPNYVNPHELLRRLEEDETFPEKVVDTNAILSRVQLLEEEKRRSEL